MSAWMVPREEEFLKKEGPLKEGGGIRLSAGRAQGTFSAWDHTSGLFPSPGGRRVETGLPQPVKLWAGLAPPEAPGQDPSPCLS